MFTVFVVFMVIVFMWFCAINIIDIDFTKKAKGAFFKYGLKTKGEELKLMTKKCECCGNRTIYVDGDDVSNLKAIVVVDPDTGEETKKLCCDECYAVIKKTMKGKDKNGIKLSSELANLVRQLKMNENN